MTEVKGIARVVRYTLKYMPSLSEVGYTELLDAGGFQPVQCAPRQLFEPDRHSQALILVRRGKVLATVVDASGKEVVCKLRGPGSLLGAEALADMEIPYLLWPLSEVELWTTSRDAMAQLLERHPAVEPLVTLAARAVGQSIEERMTLNGSASARVARFLAQTTRQLEEDRHGGGCVDESLPRHILARVLGMRPETLSRALRRLELDGAIDARNDIRVLDRKALDLACQ